MYPGPAARWAAPAKRIRARDGCLGTVWRGRAQQAAKSPGEEQASFDPGVPEWGNPRGREAAHPRPNRDRARGRDPGK